MIDHVTQDAHLDAESPCPRKIEKMISIVAGPIGSGSVRMNGADREDDLQCRDEGMVLERFALGHGEIFFKLMGKKGLVDDGKGWVYGGKIRVDEGVGRTFYR